MSLRLRCRRVGSACAVVVFVSGLPLLAGAQPATRTWDGGGVGLNWSTAANWSEDDAPDGTGEAALFTDHPVGQTKPTANLSADVVIGQLQFSSTETSYTITGTGPATLFLSPAASFTNVGLVVASGAADQAITAAEVEFLSSQTWNIGGSTTLTVTGTIEDAATIDYGLTKNGTGTLVFPGDVRHDGPNVVNAGALILSFSNTSMLSSLTVNGGLLRGTTSANALGSSSSRNTITLAGGALELANDTGLTFGSTSRITTITGNATIRSDRLTAGAGVTHRLGTLRIGAQTLSVSAGASVTSGTAGMTFGATTLSGNATFDVVNGGGASALLTLGAVGQASGTRAIAKTGDGTLLLNGAASYTGRTTLSQGELTLGVANALGSGGFTFAGGTLNANGMSDSTIGALTLTADSTLRLSPGGAAATLTFAGVSGEPSGRLTITGWSDSAGAPGNDRIFFSGAVPSSFLQRVRFDLGDGAAYMGALGAGGELVPVAMPPPPGPIDWAVVGNPGNAPDDTGRGAVADPYAISTYEVTNARYAEFLNAKAASDPHALYSPAMGSDANLGGITRSGIDGDFLYAVKPGFADKPVVYVSFWDALRFANWLHNGQGSGDTETGAYTLTPAAIATNTVTRRPDAAVFLPTEDEWYKAAYYDGGTATYFDHPTGTDAPTACVLPGADDGNAGNCWPATSPAGALTDVGAYGLSASPHGTFDQGGNVGEWNETVVGGSDRGLRGGSFDEGIGGLAASFAGSDCPSCEFGDVGFRIASHDPACSDGIDNDGDGLVDYPDDPDCEDANGASESPRCMNGIDDDGDGFIDFDGGASAGIASEDQSESDAQCLGNPWRNRETVSCGLGAELAFVLLAWRRWRCAASRPGRRS